MNSRIKQIREFLGMTLTKFSDRIGISVSGLRKLESGENNPSEQTIRAICSEFNVNRTWLETGTGQMQMPEAEDDELIDEVMRGDDEFVKAVIRGIARTPGGWEKMREVFEAIQKELDKKEKPED